MAAVIFVTALSVGLQFQGVRPPVTEAKIRDGYSALIRIEAILPAGRSDTGLALHVVAPAPDHLLASFFVDHQLWFTYLVQNGRSFQLPGLDGPPTAGAPKPGRQRAAALQADFVRRLEADSQFNSLVVPAVVGHLRAAGVPVDVALQGPASTRISLDTAMRSAVRFFYPDIVIDDRIATHICTVFNAVRELPTRNLALEALAFSAINQDINRGDSSVIEKDFGPARKLMSALDAPGPKDRRLQRAQGAMWASMATSKQLRAVILAEARKEADVLPFELAVP